MLMGLYKAMVILDANMIEINPLVITADKKLFALDAKMSFDDNALFRHEDIKVLNDNSQKDPREVAAQEHDLSYVGLEGNIGCMINGAGLAMATMDMIMHCGGKPANFLDIGGGASPERVAKAFELVLQDKEVKAMLVNIYAGINRCDWIAEGIVKAVSSMSLSVPLIVRLSGTNVEKGTKIITDSGLPIILADTLKDAAEKAVEAISS
jgi:malate-CoA ligase subunit beta